MADKKWANARWYIGGKTATTPLASETNWTRIADARAASGNFGKEWQTTDATTFDHPYRRNAKTIFDAGQLELAVLRKIGDPGQAAVKAACDDGSDDTYNFMVELDDNPNPTPGLGTPTSFRLAAQVTASVNRGGGPTNLVEAMYRLDVEAEVIETDAAA
jgi:hypothetical protein